MFSQRHIASISLSTDHVKRFLTSDLEIISSRAQKVQLWTIFSRQSIPFSATYTALRAVNKTEECDEARSNLPWKSSKAPVTMSALLHCFYLA